MADHNELGLEGEELAAEYLLKLGYTILERNWICRKDELDIISLYENRLIVTEVKTRRPDHLDDPEKSVTKAKQRRIIKTADTYMNERNLSMEARFDIIIVIIGNGKNSIRHIPAAFYPLV